MITTPYAKDIFDSEYDDGNQVEIVKKILFVNFIVKAGYGFEHHRDHVKNDEGNYKYVYDLVPILITNNFRMQ